MRLQRLTINFLGDTVLEFITSPADANMLISMFQAARESSSSQQIATVPTFNYSGRNSGNQRNRPSLYDPMDPAVVSLSHILAIRRFPEFEAYIGDIYGQPEHSEQLVTSESINVGITEFQPGTTTVSTRANPVAVPRAEYGYESQGSSWPH